MLVGRIGRPHGVTGEVTVEVRTDDPDDAVRRRVGAGHRPGWARPADRRHPRGVSGPVTGARLRRLRRPHRGREPARHAADSSRRPALPEHRTTRTSSTTTSWSGSPCVDVDGTALGTVGDVLHPPAAPVLVVHRPDGSEVLVPFVAAIVPEVDLPGGFVDRRPAGRHVRVMRRSTSSRSSPSTSPRSASRCSARRSRPARSSVAVHDLRDWTTDRHHTRRRRPVRRRPRHGDAARRVGSSAGRGAAARRHHLVVPTPAGRPFTQSLANDLAAVDHLVFACGRYEGIDQRVVHDAATADAGARGVHRRLRAGRRRGRGAGR